MKWVITLLCFLQAHAWAIETVRTMAGTQTRIAVLQVTAAYSLQPDCVEARVENGLVLLIGIRACSAHIIAIAGSTVTDLEVVVSPRPE
jgi:hypothetical protein